MGGRNVETAAANIQEQVLGGGMACNPETCDSATNQLKTGHTETRDQQLAAQSPTTRRRQETREQMPEAGDHAARVQEGAKRQESRRLEFPEAEGGPRFRTGEGKKEAAHYLSLIHISEPTRH